MCHVRLAVILLVVFGMMLCPRSVQAQEEKDKSNLESILRGVVEDLAEDQMGGQLGKIRRVEVLDKTVSEVKLEVQLRGVEDPSRAALAVEVFDERLRVVEGIEVDFDQLPQGNGSTILRVHYAGDGRMFSSVIQVSLVDESTGNPSSHRKTDLVWEWIGSGDWRPSAGGGSSSSLAPSRGDLSGTSEPYREPQIVRVDPQRVGDTPRYSSSSGASSSGGRYSRPRKTPRPETVQLAKPTPTPTRGMTLTTPMVFTSVPVVDLYKEALKANWSSAAGRIKINDKDSANSKGFAKRLGKKALHDGKSYEKVIELHPQYTDNGYIKGKYQVTLPKRQTKFVAVAGFLKGVTRTNGIHLTVSISAKGAGAKGRSKVIMNRTLSLKDPVAKISSAPIPESYWGKTVELTITVKANGSSKQDWFALSSPGIQ